MSLPECACPSVLGRPCDIERASVISGRDMDYILKLETKGLLAEAEVGFLPESVADLPDWQEVGIAYLTAVNDNDHEMISHTLFRLIELAELESQLAELGHLIPQKGGPLECYYLRRVCEICPGE